MRGQAFAVLGPAAGIIAAQLVGADHQRRPPCGHGAVQPAAQRSARFGIDDVQVDDGISVKIEPVLALCRRRGGSPDGEQGGGNDEGKQREQFFSSIFSPVSSCKGMALNLHDLRFNIRFA